MRRIGIITGIIQEARLLAPLLRDIPASEQPLLRCAGMSEARALSQSADLVGEDIIGLVSFGVAGGLEPGLKPGDLVLPERVMSENGASVACDQGWHGRARAVLDPTSSGSLVSTARPVMTPNDKSRLLKDHQAVAVDMESFAVAEFARAAGLPFLAIRVIVDPADQTIPEAALAGTPFQVMKKAVKHPGDIPALLRLGRDMEKAKKTLSRVGCDGLPFFGL